LLSYAFIRDDTLHTNDPVAICQPFECGSSGAHVGFLKKRLRNYGVPPVTTVSKIKAYSAESAAGGEDYA